jgi:hypothetical protein
MASSSSAGTVLFIGGAYAVFILYSWGIFSSVMIWYAVDDPANTGYYLAGYAAITSVFFAFAAFFITWTRDRVRFLRFFRRIVDLYAFGGKRPKGADLSGIPDRHFGLMGYYTMIKWTAMKHVEEHLREDDAGTPDALQLDCVMKDISRIFGDQKCVFRTLPEFLAVDEGELETRLDGLKLKVEGFINGELGKKVITGPAGSAGTLEGRLIAV